MNDGRDSIEGNRDDPGWRRSLVGLFILMPGISLVLAQRRAGRADGLVLIRTLYLSFVSSLVAIAGVVLVILGVTSRSEASEGAAAATILVVFVGVVSVLGSRLLGNRPLDYQSEQALAESYRKSFFLRIALAELVALVAFAASFVVGAGWLYLLGGAFSAVGFAWLAPTVGHLARRQENLRLGGCAHSLRDAIRRLPFRSP
jgi:hypothetical protein